MFIASKYEDITPIYLHTMVKKVSHGKIRGSQILKLEREIVQTLGFRLSSVPTVLEFLESYLTHNYFKEHSEHKLLIAISKFIATIQTHHIQFCDQNSSMIAAACINTALNMIDTAKNNAAKDINIKRKLDGKPAKKYAYANAEARAKLVTLVKGNPREL